MYDHQPHSVISDTSSGIKKVYRLVRPIALPRNGPIPREYYFDQSTGISDVMLYHNDILDLRYFPFIAVSGEMEGSFFDYFYKAIYDDGLDPTPYAIAEIHLRMSDEKVYDLTKMEVQKRFKIKPGTKASVLASEANLILVDRQILTSEIVKVHKIKKEFPRSISFVMFQEARQLARSRGTINLYKIVRPDENPDQGIPCRSCPHLMLYLAGRSTRLDIDFQDMATTNYQLCLFHGMNLAKEWNMHPNLLRIAKLKLIMDSSIYQLVNTSEKENIDPSHTTMSLYNPSINNSAHDVVLIGRTVEPYEIEAIFPIPLSLPTTNCYRKFRSQLRSYC